MGICAYCNADAELTMDHIEPLAKGGEHNTENVVAACGSCNAAKGSTTLLLFLHKRRLKYAH